MRKEVLRRLTLLQPLPSSSKYARGKQGLQSMIPHRSDSGNWCFPGSSL